MKIMIPSLLVLFGACGLDPGGAQRTLPSAGDADPTSPFEQTSMTTKIMNVDELIIDHTLALSPSENLEIHARRVELKAGSAIAYQRAPCDFSDAPSLTIIAEEDVIIAGGIDLRGKNGVTVAADAGCGRADGASGGSVSISADSIAVTGGVHTSAGAGAQNARDGVSGDISLIAATSIAITGTVQANGGKLDWDAPKVTFTEPSTDDATLSNAVVIPMAPMNIEGTISTGDDIASAKASDAITYTPTGKKPVRMGDLYAMVNDTAKPMSLHVEAVGGDLLAYVQILVARFEAGSWVAVTFDVRADFVAQPGTVYLIGVAAQNDHVIDYELRLTTPASLPSP